MLFLTIYIYLSFLVLYINANDIFVHLVINKKQSTQNQNKEEQRKKKLTLRFLHKNDVQFVLTSSKMTHVLFTLFVFVCIQWCPTHIVFLFCFSSSCLVYPMLPVSLDCPFLIAPSVFLNVYLHKHSIIAPSVFSNVYLHKHSIIAPSVFSNIYLHKHSIGSGFLFFIIC